MNVFRNLKEDMDKCFNEDHENTKSENTNI